MRCHSRARRRVISEQERYKGIAVYREKPSRDNAQVCRAICSSSCEARTCTRTRKFAGKGAGKRLERRALAVGADYLDLYRLILGRDLLGSR